MNEKIDELFFNIKEHINIKDEKVEVIINLIQHNNTLLNTSILNCKEQIFN